MPRYIIVIFQSIKENGAGGFGQVGYDVAAELQARGNDVLLYTINKGPFSTDFPSSNVLPFSRGILLLINKMMRVGLMSAIAGYKLQEYLFDYFLAKKNLSCDVLITAFPLLPITLQKHRKNIGKVVLIPQNPSEEYIRSLYEHEFKNYKLPVLKNDAYNDNWRIDKQLKSLKYIDEVVSISEVTHKSYIKFAGEKRCIPYYVNKNFSQSTKPHEERGSKFVFLFLAHIVLLKGLHHLMDAWHKWKGNKQAELWIVGGIDEQLKRSLNQSYGSENIHWLGYRSDIKSLISQSRIVVIPSLIDNEPQTAVEALSLRTPIIMSDGCGNAQWVKKILPEAIYAVGDVDTLSSKLQHSFEQYEEYERRSAPLFEEVLKNDNQIANFTSELIKQTVPDMPRAANLV